MYILNCTLIQEISSEKYFNLNDMHVNFVTRKNFVFENFSVNLAWKHKEPLTA